VATGTITTHLDSAMTAVGISALSIVLAVFIAGGIELYNHPNRRLTWWYRQGRKGGSNDKGGGG
jgi:hypothetical protein